MFLPCAYCSNNLNNPVECFYCHTIYCKEHINNFTYCPSCKSYPCSFIINNGIIKMIEENENEKINKKIKTDKEIIECKICSLRTNPGYLCFHLASEHKKELIDIFGRKIDCQIEKEEKYKKLPYKNDNQKDKILEIKQNFKTMNNQDNNNNINNLNNNNIIPNKIINKSNLNSKYIGFQKYNTQRLFKSQITNLYYCNKKNTTINCDCCLPNHICCQGNCLCIDCMRYNVKYFNLYNGELFNKAGKIAKPENGVYYCGRFFIVSIKNSVGKGRNARKQCSFSSKNLCEDCKILNKYKEIYLQSI